MAEKLFHVYPIKDAFSLPPALCTLQGVRDVKWHYNVVTESEKYFQRVMMPNESLKYSFTLPPVILYYTGFLKLNVKLQCGCGV